MSASTKKKAKPKGAPAKSKSKAKVTKTKKVEKVEKKVAVAAEKPKKVAPKAKKVEDKKEAPPKTEPKAQPVKVGPPPTELVAVRHIDSSHERAGRGFSFGELSSAGIPLNTAKHQDLSVDIRRRSVVDQNVEALKGWFKAPGLASTKDVAEKQVAVAAVAKKK